MSAAFAIGPVSGCCLNPALAVGVMSMHYIHTGSGMEFFALYLIVPLVAGGLACAREIHLIWQDTCGERCRGTKI